MLGIILIVLLILAVAGAPGWGYHPYGYWPSGGIGLLLVVVLLVFLLR